MGLSFVIASCASPPTSNPEARTVSQTRQPIAVNRSPTTIEQQDERAINNQVGDLSPDSVAGVGITAADDLSGNTADLDAFDARIIVLLPLTGENAAIGRALLNTVTLAVFDAADPRIAIVPMDTASDPVRMERLVPGILSRRPSAIIGPLDRDITQVLAFALAARARECDEYEDKKDNGDAAPCPTTSEIPPVFSLSNDPRSAAPGIYTFGLTPDIEVRHIVAHAVERGDTRFAALAPRGPYGDQINLAVGVALEESGGYLAQTERYTRLADSLFDPVKAITRYDVRKAELDAEIRFLRSLRDDLTDNIADDLEQREEIDGVPYDAVLIPEGGALLKTLSPLFPFYEVDSNDVNFYGTGLMNDPSLSDEPTLIGTRFAAPDPAYSAEFTKNYETVYGVKPVATMLSAYDAISLVMAALRTDPLMPLDPDQLQQSSGYRGLTGLFRLAPSGKLERSLAILEVQRDGLAVVQPSLGAFPQFGTPASGVFPIPGD